MKINPLISKIMTNFQELENNTKLELINHAIDGLKDRGAGMCGCDLHNTLFNEDYYIIGRYKAEQWLTANYGIFAAIDTIKEYEQDNFGAVNTDLSEPEKVLNMLIYILGEELLNESKTLQEKWNDELSGEDITCIIQELKAI